MQHVYFIIIIIIIIMLSADADVASADDIPASRGGRDDAANSSDTAAP